MNIATNRLPSKTLSEAPSGLYRVCMVDGRVTSKRIKGIAPIVPDNEKQVIAGSSTPKKNKYGDKIDIEQDTHTFDDDLGHSSTA